MYLPQQFEEVRLDVLHALIRSHPLGALVTLSGTELSANHLPFLIQPDQGEKGQLRGHVSRANPVWKQLGGNSEALSIAGYVLAVSGERAEAERRVQELLARRKEHYVPPYNIALIFAGLRDLDSALHWLRLARAERDVHMNFLRDHKWNVLRARREFRSLMQRIGLPVGEGMP